VSALVLLPARSKRADGAWSLGLHGSNRASAVENGKGDPKAALSFKPRCGPIAIGFTDDLMPLPMAPAGTENKRRPSALLPALRLWFNRA
jgi:hypothetical protein